MNTLPNHTALKEWSNVVAALARGEQVILIRKGGIADTKFGLEAERFYLYPTYFHQGESEDRASVNVTHWCEVVQTWTTHDRDSLERLAPLVILPGETLTARYAFRPEQALFVIAVRVWELRQPAQVRFRDAYAGCRSWISVDDQIDVEGSWQVLDETQLQAKIAAVGELLQTGSRTAETAG